MNFLRAFFAVWLVLQLGLPLAPTWGSFVPHEHLARERLTARDWQTHEENHRLPCSQKLANVESKISTVAANDGLSSVSSAIDMSALQTESAVFALNDFSATVTENCFFARAVDLPVLDPPPDA